MTLTAIMIAGLGMLSACDERPTVLADAIYINHPLHASATFRVHVTITTGPIVGIPMVNERRISTGFTSMVGGPNRVVSCTVTVTGVRSALRSIAS